MGMHLTTYVGPYLTAPKNFEWRDWDSVVCDGRMEAGTSDDALYLVPNQKVPGIDREMRVDPHGEQQVAQISLATIVRDMEAFTRLASDFINHCDEKGVKICLAWGVVPCWG